MWSKLKGLLFEEPAPRAQGSPVPTTSSMDAEEEAVAVEFINKVRREIHHLPGNVRPRKTRGQ